MAAVNVTLVGVETLDDGTTRGVTIVGLATLTGLGVGGGPVGPSGPPGHPAFPIWGPPGVTLPPGPGYPPVAGHPLPEPPPTEPPDNPDIVKPPPPQGGWGWSPQYGWGYFPGPCGSQPHAEEKKQEG